MIRNYFKVALRSIFRNKLTATINILGLGLAMAASALIYLFVVDELSYDQYHTKANRTYRITRDFHNQDGVVGLALANVAPPIGMLLKNDFGEIDHMARTINYNMVISKEEDGEIKAMNNEEYLFVAEPEILKIFDVETVNGNAESALQRPYTVMLSEKTAQRYFNSLDVIGKRLRGNSRFDLEVTGVFKDFPLQSHWHPEFLISFSTLEDDKIYGRKGLETNWGNNSFGTYIVLQEGTDPKKFEAGLPAFIDKHFGPFAKANWGVPADWVASKSTTLHVGKLTDIHLASHRDDELEPGGTTSSVYVLGAIGCVIIIIAGFNFINLSTAQATKRAKEVGLRKVVGAFRNQLIVQYLGESVLIALFALVLGSLLAVAGLQWINEFTGKQLDVLQLPLIGGAFALAIVIGILAGIYPALVISGFKPALTLKTQSSTSQGRGLIRKVLVVSQFAVSIVLIIATIITFQQLDYLNSRDLGYTKDLIVTMPYYRQLEKNYESFYNDLEGATVIENLTRSSRAPTGRLLDSYGGAKILKGDSLIDADVDLKTISIDEDFFDTYNIGMAAGRNFSKSIRSDDSLAFIINEAGAKKLGWTNLNKQIDRQFEYAGVNGKLIGIVKDFHFESLHQKITPMIFLFSRENFNTVSVKISGNNMQEGLQLLETKWRSFIPDRPFEFSFLTDKYARLYDAELKQNQLLTSFAGLAIFIACLGLFGLATFNTMQRIKEIGIRKVLGASVPGILTLLSREIVILIVIANFVAWPVAWYMMNQWLSSFAYHIDMNVLIYIAAAGIAVIIALLTVSMQTLKAARANPAKTLRYE